MHFHLSASPLGRSAPLGICKSSFPAQRQPNSVKKWHLLPRGQKRAYHKLGGDFLNLSTNAHIMALLKTYDGLNEDSQNVLDCGAVGVFMSLLMDEAKRLINTIVTTREQWCGEEPHQSTLKEVHYIEDIEGFKEVMHTKGKEVKTLQAEQENIDLYSIYQQEDELYETLESFKHYQGVNKEFRKCFHHHRSMISHLAKELDKMGLAVKNLGKHTHMIDLTPVTSRTEATWALRR